MVPHKDSDLINALNLACISNLMTSLDKAVVEMRRWEVGLAGRCRSKGMSSKHVFPLTLSFFLCPLPYPFTEVLASPCLDTREPATLKRNSAN